MEKRTGTVETLDSGGNWGKPGGVWALPAELRDESGVHVVEITYPDGTKNEEYRGADRREAELIFGIVCGSRVPDDFRGTKR